MSLSLQVFLPRSVTTSIGQMPAERLFNSKTRLPKIPSADEFFFGVTNLEVKLLYPIVPLIGIPVGDFRGMHEKFVPNPRVFTHRTGAVRPAQ